MIGGGKEEQCTECGGTGMRLTMGMPVPDKVEKKIEKYKRLTKATHAASKRLDRNNNGIPDDEEMEEGFGDAGDKEMKVGDTKKTRTGELTKTSTGVTHKNTSYKDEGDEIASNAKSGKGIKSHAKAQSAAEKKEKAPAQKMSPKSAKTWGMKDNEKFDNRDKQKDESVAEGKKKGDGNLANNAKPYDKVTRGDVIAGRLGKDEKGGKDKKVKEAAAMWKNIKETTAYIEEKKAATKDLPGNQEKIDVAEPKGKIDGKDMAALRAKKEKVKESTDMTRMRELTGRLNLNENVIVKNSNEVDQLKALTNLFKG
jgi:hypothetical protein